jgi:phosphonate transport system substrate-binding protein
MERLRSIIILFSLSLLVMSFLPGCSEKKDSADIIQNDKSVTTENVVIALLPKSNVFEQKKRYKLLGDYLSRVIGRNVKMKLLDSYDAVYDEMLNNKVDAAIFGSLSYVVMDSKIPLVPLARPSLKDGRSTYRGLIIVSRDSSITDDVSTWKGKRIALVNKSTTAGYIFPKWYLYKSGIRNFEGYFKKVFYAGSHDSAVLSVFSDEADIGCASDDVFYDLIKKNQLINEKLKIIASSSGVPLNVFGIRQSADPELRKQLKDALLGMDKTHEGQAALSSLEADRFIETKKSEFDPVIKMLEAIGMKPGDFTLDAIGQTGITRDPQSGAPQ